MANKVKLDVLLKDFWRSNERFADLFNAVMFQGEEVLRAEELQEMDTDVSGIIQLKDHAESLMRIRDVVKKMAFGVEFVVFGIESQQNIHYAMPLRTMLYDGMGYLKEYQEITRSHKAEKAAMSKAEFLSGMKKEDRLHPILSIVIYYSEEPWDGPLCLKDMMVEMPEEIRKIFSDYKMNLVQVQDSGQYVFHNEDVRLVFELSREFFQGDLEKIKEKYKNQDIKQELLMVIGKIIDSSELMHWKQEGKVENVCTAVKKWEKEWYENGREEGREEGRKSGIADMVSAMKELGITQEVIVEKLCEKFEFTEEEAKQYM
ncbi:MAG: hypothetical protein UHO63_08780 [Blautia sp.]|nr:hypothetical protein [Blautia sp.]